MKKYMNYHLISTIVVASIIALVLVMAFLGIDRFDRSTSEKDQKALADVIRKAAVQCYATEGSYPPDIGYLAEHYGVVLNNDAFYYHYEVIGSNVMPDIEVIRKQASEK